MSAHRNSAAANGNSRLREEDVHGIRRLYASGDYSQSVLAERYGVHLNSVSSILRGRTWKALSVQPSHVAELLNADSWTSLSALEAAAGDALGEQLADYTAAGIRLLKRGSGPSAEYRIAAV